MVTYNDLTIDNERFIQEKAKSKADGVYTIRGIGYRVRDGRATHYASNGKIVESCGYFNCNVGSYDTREEGQKLLKSI